MKKTITPQGFSGFKMGRFYNPYKKWSVKASLYFEKSMVFFIISVQLIHSNAHYVMVNESLISS